MALIAAVVIALDQWTKTLVETHLGPAADQHVMSLVGDWLALEYARNTGAAFGFLQSQPAVVLVVAAVVLCGLVWWITTHHRGQFLATVATGFIVGGAVGNLIDRVRLGYVTDFIAVGAWPNFNLADSSITLGVLMLVFALSRTTDTDIEKARD